MILRFLALSVFTSLVSCQRPDKPAALPPKEYQSKPGSTAELRLAQPNPDLSAKAPISITTSGPVEAVPEKIEFSIDLTKLDTTPDLLEELAKPYQFGSTSTLTFSSESVVATPQKKLTIRGNWTFDGQSKPVTISGEWSMDGSQMQLSLSPAFRLRDFRPMPKDAPKQTIDPRFQLSIETVLSPRQ